MKQRYEISLLENQLSDNCLRIRQNYQGGKNWLFSLKLRSKIYTWHYQSKLTKQYNEVVNSLNANANDINLFLMIFVRMSLHCKLVPDQYREYQHGLFRCWEMCRNKIWFKFRQLNPEIAEYFNCQLTFFYQFSKNEWL